MIKKPLKVHLVQMRSINSFEKNLKFMLKEINKIKFSIDTINLVSFPENCLFFRLEKNESMPFIQITNKIFKPLRDIAREKNIHLILGSVPLRIKMKNYSSMVWINSKGSLSHPYQKIHLFDVDLPGNKIQESKTFSAGSRPFVCQIEGWKLGLSICFDIRFSSLFQYYQQQKVDAILLPSAFTVPTGKAHWEILLRARAIESQAYLLAPAQSGSHLDKRFTFGHTMIVDPWGTILQRKKKSLGTIGQVLDDTFLTDIRKKIPMGHRKII